MAHPRRVFIRKQRSPFWAAVTGAAVGSALTWWFDPQTGRRRRETVRDKAADALRQAQEAVGRRSKDLVDRARGRVIDALRPPPADVSDESLVERVTAELNRVSSHAAAIEVSCIDGVVMLRGPILKSELNRVLRSVRRIPGVKEIHDNLEAHRLAEGVPGLEAPSPRRRHSRLNGNRRARFDRIAGATGVALAAYGLVRRKPVSVGAGLAGIALFARSVRDGHPANVTRIESVILADDPEGVFYESVEQDLESGDGAPERSIH